MNLEPLPTRTRATRVGRTLAALGALLMAVTLWLAATPAHAEYGDVVMNNFSDKAGMRPVVFPHWFHRVRYRCKVCHADLGFQFKAGGNQIDMLKIIDGQFCGACHNGEIAWNVESCNLCHSGKPGLPTHVHESTVHALTGGAAPAAPAAPATSTTPAAAGARK
jgi:c(7)-type cytochrome triheme protein